MWAFRVRVERLNSVRFHKLQSSKDKRDLIHNGTILHYTRVHPTTGIYPYTIFKEEEEELGRGEGKRSDSHTTILQEKYFPRSGSCGQCVHGNLSTHQRDGWSLSGLSIQTVSLCLRSRLCQGWLIIVRILIVTMNEAVVHIFCLFCCTIIHESILH